MKLFEISKTSEGTKRSNIMTTLYHVTSTKYVPDILKNGILPLKTSNWIKAGDQERYGGGNIFCMSHLADAVRWAGKMDWEFNKTLGSGQISIVEFNDDLSTWKVDDADPLSQAGAAGKWLKKFGRVKPEQITKYFAVTLDDIRKARL